MEEFKTVVVGLCPDTRPIRETLDIIYGGRRPSYMVCKETIYSKFASDADLSGESVPKRVRTSVDPADVLIEIQNNNGIGWAADSDAQWALNRVAGNETEILRVMVDFEVAAKQIGPHKYEVRVP